MLKEYHLQKLSKYDLAYMKFYYIKYPMKNVFQINFIKNLLESMKEKLKKKLSYHLTSSKENMLDTKN